jgi:hypothetical protein
VTWFGWVLVLDLAASALTLAGSDKDALRRVLGVVEIALLILGVVLVGTGRG